ncbi:MAG: hypothetical protein JSV55_09065 [Deltaproteobacteria bacterium]|nr:MAG: hypothetical protein JSV55_09065 [Deltaproteobacteria bacterium]
MVKYRAFYVAHKDNLFSKGGQALLRVLELISDLEVDINELAWITIQWLLSRMVLIWARL